ncbi:23S rRNA (pseudouridine(1915)-N(3))-methyltransferase RlmH [Facilibium subflavum]|uniref:23S rRNA (pseudouridine(1915)-N(3))-methyltransferase RlmH n=1 Tax=Facilibium subflavum TaxID=2219058 RepID=UPI000E64A59D|nr:23S rRNA (pseudouridine(1915)-N(3))-methyltransferase RlmH [Facilibium subflavum]
MKIKIIALGQKMPGWVNAGFDEYKKRLNGSEIQLELIELPIAKRGKTGSISVWLEEEAKRVKAKLTDQDHLVVLDITAKLISTEDLAEKLDYWQQNHKSVALLIGGPDGIDSTLKKQAGERISFSKMTFPHPLVRIILVEQLYRAMSILKGHPYHK